MEEIRITKSKESGTWSASIGQVALDLLFRKGLNESERSRLLNESIGILENCGNPNNEENDVTGIVIGYVQSGKTLSFTTVSALAAQNGFNVIIVIAGTTTSLVEQTHTRLADDLEINISAEVSWKTYKNPTKQHKEEVIADLEPGILNKNPVLLITVMKNSTHLRNLNYLFGNGLDTRKCKVLIIDDEADQASLNTKASKKNENEVSTTYDLIRELKSTFPNHTYLQYTATPQAPLFISILDILSPSFVKILTPGSDYTGGKVFFKRNKNSDYPHVIDIPNEEIYDKNNPISKIPDSLVEATIFFFLTVVIGALNGEKPQTHSRTMMVHPSQLKLVHSIYERWLIRLKNRWLDEFALPDSDPDKIILIKNFHDQYKKLKSNHIDIHSFEEILKHLSYVIKVTPIYLSNSSSKQDVDFKKNYSAILVGGQVLDRGFTVEGLNVTYMPRSIGVGNADTLQQRCRFFGYKRKYLDLCRIYLPRRSKRAYIDYVTHEEDLRNKLDKHDKELKSLKDFKRMFILSPDLNITRRNVISDDLRRYRLKGWRQILSIDPNYIENNQVIDSYLKEVKFNDLKTHDIRATDIQRHEFAIIKATTIVEMLLLSLQYKNASNSLLINHLLSLIGIMIEEDRDLNIYLVNMSKGIARTRSVTSENRIKNILQGANPKTNYRGDRSISSEELITIQFHNIDVKDQNKIFKTMAIHFPMNIAQNIVSIES